jgi:8-oxo-dGTP diphosphatase
VTRKIRIAAALIDDDEGLLLLVRKAGTRWFMQPGGKIEPGETALSALERELREEIGLALGGRTVDHLGQFSALAANEPGAIVDAKSSTSVSHTRLRSNRRLRKRSG